MLQIHYDRNDLPVPLVRTLANTAARITAQHRNDALALSYLAEHLRRQLDGDTYQVRHTDDGVAVFEAPQHHAIQPQRLALVSAAPQRTDGAVAPHPAQEAA